jgi:hypothetical protein
VSTPVIDKFLRAIESATIPACDVWSADAASDVIEYTLSWSENGVPHAAHHLHLLTVRDGLITADTVLCGGRWPASLLAEMEAADA